MEFTKEQLTAMREWLADCQWGDLESEDLEQLTDDEVVKGVKRHYSGGLVQFVSDCNPL